VWNVSPFGNTRLLTRAAARLIYIASVVIKDKHIAYNSMIVTYSLNASVLIIHRAFSNYRLRKISWNTTFIVLSIQTPPSSSSKIFRPFIDVTLDIATYSWPCDKTGCGRYTVTCFRDFPWLLLMVIANHTDIENCLRWNLKGILVSEGDRDSLGIYTLSPIFVPVITFASRISSFILTSLSSPMDPSPIPCNHSLNSFLSRVSFSEQPCKSLILVVKVNTSQNC
jgi:hypothetical protein